MYTNDVTYFHLSLFSSGQKSLRSTCNLCLDLILTEFTKVQPSGKAFQFTLQFFISNPYFTFYFCIFLFNLLLHKADFPYRLPQSVPVEQSSVFVTSKWYLKNGVLVLELKLQCYILRNIFCVILFLLIFFPFNNYFYLCQS